MSTMQLIKALAIPRKGLKPGETIPRLSATQKAVRAEAGRLSQYRALCGFRDDGLLPATYPQLLAGDLHIGLLADRAFPLPVAGIVHVENRIVEHRSLPEDGLWDIEVCIEGHREDGRGLLFDIETRMTRGTACVWEATTTVLSRPRGKAAAKPKGEKPAAPSGPAEAPVPETPPLRSALFKLPENLGRRFSVLAGDYNPIHLSALTAKPFGFKRAIIHGMWSLARVLGEIGDDLPALAQGARETRVKFERPVFLPSTVHLSATRVAGADTGGEIAFALTSPDLKTRHLRGSVGRQS